MKKESESYSLMGEFTIKMSLESLFARKFVQIVFEHLSSPQLRILFLSGHYSPKFPVQFDVYFSNWEICPENIRRSLAT